MLGMEEKLREAEETFQAIIDGVPDGMLLAESGTGKLLLCNRALCRMLGHADSDLKRLRYEILGNEVLQHIHAGPEHDEQTSLSAPVIRSDGSSFQADITVSPLIFHEQRCLLVYFRDSGAMHNAQESLRRQQELTSQIVDNIPHVVFWKDRESRYLGCNTSAARITGLASPADIVGKSDFDMPWTRDEAEYYRKVDREVMESGMAQMNIEESQRQADGSDVFILTSKVPLRNKDGKVAGILGIFSDITERKKMEIALRESEERYHAIFKKSKVPMLLIDPRDGAIVEANEAACRYYAYPAGQLEQMRITDINTFSQEQVRQEMLRAEQERRSHFYFRHRLAGGEIRDVEVHSGPLRIGRRELLYSVIHDITERRQAEKLLRESEARFRRVLENAPVGVEIFALNGRFMLVNKVLCDIVGVMKEELESMSIDDITDPDDKEIGSLNRKKLLSGEILVARYEKRYLRRDGRQVWMQINMTLERDESGAPLYFIGMAEDIGKRKEAEQRISFLAHHDRLTGLPNRELFADRLSRSISQAKRKHEHLALLFLDLDGFKAVNDKFGHDAGDAVLKVVAKRLLECVREIDTVARLGGDEFAIIFDEIEDVALLSEVAEQIIRSLDVPIPLDAKRECSIGVSIGIAGYPEHGTEIDRLMRAADDAMYASKRHGKNRYTLFTWRAEGYSGDYPWITMDESHLTGSPELDRQHQVLVNMLNNLNDAVRNSESQQTVDRMFDEMVAYAEKHFEFEERLMVKYAYPDMLPHKDEHERLKLEAKYLREELKQGGELLVLQSVKDWLLAHTVNIDKPFAEYLMRRSEGNVELGLNSELAAE